MIYAAAGSTIKWTNDGAPHGLVGTYGVRIIQPGVGTILARSTAGIVEEPAASGVYTATIVVPDDFGQYLLVADTGGGSPLYVQEGLTVNVDGEPDPDVAGIDLTTLAAVRRHMRIPTDETDADDQLQILITAASTEIRKVCSREFSNPGVATRRVEVDISTGRVDLAPWDLQSITSLTVDPDSNPVTLTADVDFRMLPVNREDGVWTGIRFYNLLPGTGVAARRRVLEITGTWGFPAVPAEVAHWCNVTVAEWYRRDSMAFGGGFQPSEDQLERPTNLPGAVISGLSHFRRYSVTT